MKVRVPVLAPLAAVVLLAGCSNQAPENVTAPSGDAGKAGAGGSELTVAVVSHGKPGDSFWDIVKTGAEQAGKDLKVNVTYSGDGDPAKQSQLIDNAVAQRVDGLVVSMANPGGVRSSVEKAVHAGIPVITINSGLEESTKFGAITHVGQGEELAGEAAGKRFKAAGKTKMICVIHEAGNVGLEDRCAGAKKTFGNAVDNVQVDVSNAAGAESTIKSKLLSDTSVDAVLTLNPVIAKAALSGVKGANSKAQVATFDVSSDIVSAIESGDMLFAVDQQPYLQGYLPVQFLALKARNGNDVGGGQPVYSGPGFVTKDNAAQVKQFAARGTR